MKRITTILTFLMLMCMGAWAAYGPTTSQTISISTSTGTFAQGNNSWNRTWTSTQTFPRLTLSTTTTGSNGNVFMPISNETYSLDIRNGFEYNFSVSEGYIITSYRVTATAQKTENKITVNGVETNFEVGVENYVEVNVNAQSTTSGTNSFRVSENKAFYANIEVNIKWDPITASSQFSNSKIYTVTSHRQNASWFVASGGSNLDVNYSGYAYSQTDAKQQFAFITYDENLYIYNIGTKKFLRKDNTLDAGGGDPVNIGAGSPSYPDYPILMSFDNDHVINLNSDGTDIVIDSWGGSSGSIDEGNSFAVLPVGDYDLSDAINVLKGPITVTYYVIAEENGTPITSENQTNYRGRALAVPSSLERAFCSWEYYTDAACTSQITNIAADYEGTTLDIYAKYTADLPFTPSADYASANWYYMHMRQGGYNVKYEAGATKYALEAVGSFNRTEKDKYSWAFVGNPIEGFQVINKAAGSSYKLYAGDTPSNGGYPLMNNEKETNWIVVEGGSENGAFGLKVPNKNLYINDYSGSKFMSFWEGNAVADAGSRITVEVMPEALYEITYVLPGTSLSNETVLTAENANLSIPSAWQRDGVTFTYYSTYSDGVFSNPITSATADATVYVDYTYSLSSIISADVEHLKWYRLAASSQGAYWDLYYNGSAPYPYKVQSAFDGSNGYFWAFVGNPFDGFKVYNKAVATTNTMIHNNNTNPIMDTDDGTKWYITINNGMIGFKYTGNAGHRWNDHGGGAATLKYYGSESWHQYTNINDVDYSGLVTKNIQPYVDNCGNGYFQITSSYASAMAADISSANLDETISLSEYQELVSALTGMIKWPATGYYRIKSVSAETYLKATNANQLNVGGTNSEVASIVYLTGSAGNYTMQMQGKYVAIRANSGATYLVDGTVTNHFTVPTNASGVVQPGQAIIGGGLTATDYMRVDNSNVVGVAFGQSPIGNNACYWTVEPATSATVSLTAIGGNTYATTYLPFDVTVSGSDVTANAIVTSDVHTGYVVPTELEDKIPAGTPVILKGNSTSATSATLTINTGDAFSAISGTSALKGVYVNTDFSLSETDDESNSCTADYFLGMLDGALGFYHSAIETPASSGNYTLSANRAYLPASVVATAGSRGFSIKWNDDELTGIGDASHLKQKAESRKQMFDLQGRRVENPQRGLYIVGGRKIVIK